MGRKGGTHNGFGSFQILPLSRNFLPEVRRSIFALIWKFHSHSITLLPGPGTLRMLLVYDF